jgi:hypothetical protein
MTTPGCVSVLDGIILVSARRARQGIFLQHGT